MINTAIKITLTVMIAGLLVSGAYAGPISLSETQMDSVAAGGVYKVSAFVCPVITQDAVGMHNPQAGPLGDTGNYTVVPETANNGDLYVPKRATNADGYGLPGGPHSAPGDTDYTAIWARQQ
jgi:hypothetical protein